MFALCVEGLADLLSREIASLHGLSRTETGFDGRSDVVCFDAARGSRPSAAALTINEDLFVEVGRAAPPKAADPGRLAAALWAPDRVERALSVWAEQVRPLTAAMQYRVIVRVLQETSFLRRDLREQVSRLIRSERPRWKVSDPAPLEIWVLEYAPGKYISGLRLSDVSKRQAGGRAVERPGALRPSVAAAMLTVAGEPSGLLVDPCCGSGTILRAAQALGWQVEGSDIDPEAVQIARSNVPGAVIREGDARELPLADGSVTACVSNLPFGKQYGVDGPMVQWQRQVLSELARVTMPGGHVVVLAPSVPPDSDGSPLRLADQWRIRLLGEPTTLWAFERT